MYSLQRSKLCACTCTITTDNCIFLGFQQKLTPVLFTRNNTAAEFYYLIGSKRFSKPINNIYIYHTIYIYIYIYNNVWGSGAWALGGASAPGALQTSSRNQNLPLQRPGTCSGA